ncbi:IS66 family insertion sequence element accessory protein TnpB [Clostridium sp. HBUAS56010]|uniref:IS66 family insertion sequence element accessory protein TnpA n=1 Tax=Clostridium sp. HBUAS56010 TaxID=2571127 RepID=UPI0011786FF2|nr:IS66 family insertion sequence element accessory protein TnpB [Clostridium sp. HBUAS56010]
MDKITHEVRLINWTKLIKECLSSGLSKKQWCSQNQIDEKQFYYWQRRVREEIYAEQVSAAPAERSTSFVEIPSLSKVKQPKSTNVSAQIHVNGCAIEIADSASDEFLRRLLGALSYVQ